MYNLYVCIHLIVYISLQKTCAQKYRLEFKFLNYTNPNHWDETQTCCDQGIFSCYVPCETMFTLCLRDGRTDHANDVCSWPDFIVTSGVAGRNYV